MLCIFRNSACHEDKKSGCRPLNLQPFSELKLTDPKARLKASSLICGSKKKMTPKSDFPIQVS